MPTRSPSDPPPVPHCRVGFSFLGSDLWTGGLTYLKNLLIALAAGEEQRVAALLMVDAGSKASRQVEELAPYAAICCPEFSFRRWSWGWLRWHAMRLARRRDRHAARLLDRFCADQRINALFRMDVDPFLRTPQLCWIPDFQHVHLPELFSPAERQRRDRRLADATAHAARIVVSSEDVRKDAVACLPGSSVKLSVLRFVAHVPPRLYAIDLDAVRQRYRLPEKFFYLPNQFWKHKNHETVFRAIALLKQRGLDVSVVCTGMPFDNRHPTHFAEVLRMLSEQGIRPNVTFLGLVAQDEVYALLRQSVAVINPSRFEGWSTTVEECKSVGKRMILSNLAVHQEQAPPASVYFEPLDAEGLALQMRGVWECTLPGPDLILEEKARAAYPRRQAEFADTFLQICQLVCGSI